MSGRLMKRPDVADIERSLDVSLPRAYVEFLTARRGDSALDATEVLDDATAIVNATELYRRGFEGLRRWPRELVYVGDQADACPYVLNCTSGEVMQTDKGNLERPALQRWTSFEAYSYSMEPKGPSPGVSPMAARVMEWLPVIALVVIFVLVPILAYSVRAIFRWLFA
jgi:hypothetical protein